MKGGGERSLGLSEYRANLPYDNHKLPEKINWISYDCNFRPKTNLFCCAFASEKLVEGGKLWVQDILPFIFNM